VPQTIAPNSDLSFGPATYVFQGAALEPNINFTATEVPTGGPLVPSFNTFGNGALATGSGTRQILTIPTSLQWINPIGYPRLATASDPITNLPSSAGTAEFPLATNAGTYSFGLLDTSTTFGGNITLTDNGQCSGITANYIPILNSPSPYASLTTAPYVQIQMGSSAATSMCIVTASDNLHTATLQIYTDQSTLTIQNKARKH
jgi:hypothetical protein